MTATEMVKAALIKAGKTHRELAEFMGWSPQNLSGRLKNNSLTFDELTKALGFAGYAVNMTDAEGDDIPNIGNSSSPKLVQMVDGVVYDTSKAESICTSKEEDPDDLYMELFREATGGYFLAFYQLWEGGHNNITPVNNQAARRFWERYGESRLGKHE